jgi:hypothetical protein
MIYKSQPLGVLMMATTWTIEDLSVNNAVLMHKRNRKNYVMQIELYNWERNTCYFKFRFAYHKYPVMGSGRIYLNRLIKNHWFFLGYYNLQQHEVCPVAASFWDWKSSVWYIREQILVTIMVMEVGQLLYHASAVVGSSQRTTLLLVM